MMRIARMLSPVHSLGPGERVCLWMQGCSKKCPGCISDEMQGEGGSSIDEEMLAKVIIMTAQKGGCTGITISGGDPFEQSEGLHKLLGRIREHFEDILVYTGYTLGEIKEGKAGESGIKCLDLIDVLIDGRYIDGMNTPELALRGSSNQVIHFLNPDVQDRFEEYMKSGRVIETFRHEDTIIVTGILNREDSTDTSRL